ncbi:sugar MFS transporter [Cytophagaceae bacterium DM2B3-1]|uniref:Sugar MFS transporter n=1 Tax=Xanthocytophaga flava TaxID=3048013 RepID=A0ABT7CKD8_9BACT|nr:sugar MFS transporter [Xanthocytophaga flavus]MDJ1494207.1 sugar MFS transporter [Xanthocytophaga flavus]
MQTVVPAQSKTKQNYALPLAIIGVLFFLFGFITWTNSVLIPYLKLACELNTSESYLVTFAFYISYFVMALPSGWVLQKTGFKKGMILGLLVMCIGMLVFIPAALTRTYSVFLLGLFIVGSGLAVLQTASNPYITVLGPIESAAQRISIMGICNKLAGTLSPLLLGSIFMKDTDKLEAQIKTLSEAAKAAQLDELAQRVIVPYSIMAAALVGLAMMVYFSHLPEVSQSDDTEDKATETTSTRSSVLSFPNLVLGFIALFLYVGVEVIAGDTIAGYGQFWGYKLSEASKLPAYPLGGMVIGYIAGILLIPKYLTQNKALVISAVSGLIFAIGALFTRGDLSIYLLAGLGLANALIWPAIWPLALNKLGSFTALGSSILVMGIAGGAILPLLYGQLTDKLNAQQAYWLVIPCYLFILYYALAGHKKKSW